MTQALQPRRTVTEKGVSVEIYRKLEPEQAGKPDAEELMARRRDYCERLGLNEQAGLFDKELGFEEFAGKMYHELAGYELAIMSQYLPERYSRKNGWGRYAFDVIPLRVLEEISIAVSLGTFNDVEIWTPETKRTDPLAVGVISLGQERKTYIISRWAESLKSFPEIEAEVIASKITTYGNVRIPEDALRIIKEMFKKRPGVFTYRGKSFPFLCCRRIMDEVHSHSAGWVRFCTRCGRKK